MTADAATWSPSRHRWLWRAAIILIVVGGVTAFVWHITAPQRLISEIEAAGGAYNEWDRSSFAARLLGRLWNSPVPQAERRVALTSPDIDDAWLESHDQLAALPLTSICLYRTSLSPDGVRHLISVHQLQELEATDVPLTDDDASLLNQHVDLNGLDVSGSRITDAGLVQFDLPKLRWLKLYGTRITPSGLIKWLPGSSVTGLALDARQFTPEVVQTLQAMSQITSLQLYGADIDDAHLARLSAISTLQHVEIWESSVSREAAEALRDAHPEWQLRITLPEGSIVQMQPVRSPAPVSPAP